MLKYHTEIERIKIDPTITICVTSKEGRVHKYIWANRSEANLSDAQKFDQ